MTIDTIDAGKLIGTAAGKAVAEQLAEALPPVFAGIADTLARTLAQLAQPHVCATCLARRVSWEKANRTAVEEALAASQAASASHPGTPADFTQFLPERLRAAGIPDVKQAITTCRGTDVCAEHVEAGAPLLAATMVPPGALTQPGRLLPG